MMRYPILLFDADGTLLDFEQTEADALPEVFSALGRSYQKSLS